MAGLKLDKESKGFKHKTRTGAPTPQMEYDWVIYDGAREVSRFPFEKETEARGELARLQAGRKNVPFAFSMNKPRGW